MATNLVLDTLHRGWPSKVVWQKHDVLHMATCDTVFINLGPIGTDLKDDDETLNELMVLEECEAFMLAITNNRVAIACFRKRLPQSLEQEE